MRLIQLILMILPLLAHGNIPLPLSSPEQIGALSTTEDELIGSIVSPLSGQPIFQITDLVVQGAQPISLRRLYLPPQIFSDFPIHKEQQEEHNKKYLHDHLSIHYRGWQVLPHLRLEFNPLTQRLRVAEPSGIVLDFVQSKSGQYLFDSASFAISNLRGEMLSGAYDPRNIRISQADDGDRITIHAADGTTRIYKKMGWQNQQSHLYLLKKEILLNGKILRYQYNDKNLLCRIESLDAAEKYVYASLDVSGTPWDKGQSFKSATGLRVDHFYVKKDVKWKIKEKNSLFGKWQEEAESFYPPLLTAVSSPQDRNETITYGDRLLMTGHMGKTPCQLQYTPTGYPDRHERIHQLLFPVGKDDAYIPVYTFTYQPPVAGQKKGSTTITLTDGSSIIYHFSKELLPTSIQWFDQHGELRKEKLLTWNEQQWLESLEILDGHHHSLLKKEYAYDRFGNPIRETIIGDLTGSGAVEDHVTMRTFSDDGLHLLLTEDNGTGKVVCFSYLPNTNLISSKFVKQNHQILYREFYQYDESNNLIKTILDDGSSEHLTDLSGITQRTSKTYLLRNSSPFLHCPEWIEESFWESGSETLFRRTQLTYDAHGNISQEKHFDAADTLLYTLNKTYNERGDLISETNPLNQSAVSTYTPKGLLASRSDFSGRLKTLYQYDKRGRLIQSVQQGDDHLTLTTQAEYDAYDRQLRTTDPLGNVTHYTYPAFLHTPCKIRHPAIASFDGEAIAVATSLTYDPLERVVSTTDANGNTTSYQYTAYGHLSLISYPDGAVERFSYDRLGNLIDHTDLNGCTTRYEWDVFNHPISIRRGDSTEFFHYTPFHLLSATDPEGYTTCYTYDGAGRKIRETRAGTTIQWQYDSSGHPSTIIHFNQDNALLTHYKRDRLGNVLEREETDSTGRLLSQENYSYTKDGQIATITRHVNDHLAIETFTYDSQGRLILYKDPCGYITTTLYRTNHQNLIGQHMLQKEIRHPTGITTIQSYDALNRLFQEEVLDSQHETLSRYDLTYDPHGNLIYRQDHVYANGLFRETVLLKNEYTTRNQLARSIRGYGTSDARKNEFTYAPAGQMRTQTRPCGTTLFYEYDLAGCLASITSSDQQIHHTFEYNRNGHLIQASDLNQQITIDRSVDPFGNTLTETASNGVQITKEYDAAHRPITLQVGPWGKICYEYDPLWLRKITRLSEEGQPIYSHTYDQYDESGHLITENLIAGAGMLTHAYTARGETISLHHPLFSESIQFNPAGQPVERTINDKLYRYSYNGLSQLTSELLPSHTWHYHHDSLHNRIRKNGIAYAMNVVCELLPTPDTPIKYDLEGNIAVKHTPSGTFQLHYDPLNRLTTATNGSQKIVFSYDPLHRLLSRTVYNGAEQDSCEHYFYDDLEEIGSFDDQLRLLNLKVANTSLPPVAIESHSPSFYYFAPLIDLQGNVRALIDPHTQTLFGEYPMTFYGEKEGSANPFNPWQFAAKRIDPLLGIVYFGSRLYDPQLGRWMNMDTDLPITETNPYVFVRQP